MYTKEDVVKFIEESDEINRQIARTTFEGHTLGDGVFYIFGDWDDVETVQKHFEPHSDHYDSTVLDNNDIAWGFSDEYGVCEQCGELIEFALADHAIMWHDVLVCGDCIRGDENNMKDYIADLVNQPKHANTILKPEDLCRIGCKVVKSECESGLYGRCDNPSEILTQKLAEKPKGKFFFSIDDNQMFLTEYSLWEMCDHS